jgi:hypothetical protein
LFHFLLLLLLLLHLLEGSMAIFFEVDHEQNLE